jgi:hypothetical protein
MKSIRYLTRLWWVVYGAGWAWFVIGNAAWYLGIPSPDAVYIFYPLIHWQTLESIAVLPFTLTLIALLLWTFQQSITPQRLKYAFSYFCFTLLVMLPAIPLMPALLFAPPTYLAHGDTLQLSGYVLNLAMVHTTIITMDSTVEYVLYRCDSLSFMCEDVMRITYARQFGGHLRLRDDGNKISVVDTLPNAPPVATYIP